MDNTNLLTDLKLRKRNLELLLNFVVAPETRSKYVQEISYLQKQIDKIFDVEIIDNEEKDI